MPDDPARAGGPVPGQPGGCPRVPRAGGAAAPAGAGGALEATRLQCKAQGEGDQLSILESGIVDPDPPDPYQKLGWIRVRIQQKKKLPVSPS